MHKLTSTQGTRKYIARRVQRGKDRNESTKAVDHCFPTLTDTARDLFVAAYGNDTYVEYAEDFDKMQRSVAYKPDDKFLHRPHHDMDIYAQLCDILV